MQFYLLLIHPYRGSEMHLIFLHKKKLDVQQKRRVSRTSFKAFLHLNWLILTVDIENDA